MRRPGRAGSRRALAVPVLGLLGGAVYTLGATEYPVGTAVAPGPGLFPLLAGLTMTLAGVIALITEARAPSAIPAPLGPSFRRVPLLVASLAAYAIVLKAVGFLVAAATLSAVVLVVLGRRRAAAVVGIAITMSAGAYVTFRLLGVPLPPGPFGL